MKIFVYVILAGILVYWSIQDIKYMKIRILELIVAAVVSFGMIFARQDDIHILLAGLIPGLLSLLASKITGEKIGYADGAVLLVTGGAVGIWNILGIWIYAAFIAGITGLVLMVIKKAGKSTRIPFIPFILAGFVIQAGVEALNMYVL